MSLADEMAYGLRQLIADQGSSITLRKVTTKPGANPASNPPTYYNLKVDGATLTGASSIDMTADAFTGRLIPGDTFTIAGDLTEYTVAAEVISSTTTDDLPNVTFTPVLAADAADLAVVTLTSFMADITIMASVTDEPAALYPAGTTEFKDHRIRFLNSDLPTGVTPEIGDLVLLSSSDISKVIQWSHVEMSGVHYGWLLRVRA